MVTNVCDVLLSCSVAFKGAEGPILLDYSKNIITKETMKLLFQLVSQWGLQIEQHLCALEPELQANCLIIEESLLVVFY